MKTKPLLEKTGDLRSDSRADFFSDQPVQYIDDASPYVSSKRDKKRLKNPKPWQNRHR